MEVIASSAIKIPGPVCLMIGNYDGVHLGHQAVINRAQNIAQEHGLKTAVLSFEPHPLKILAPDKAPQLLYTPAQKQTLLQFHGIDRYIIQHFDQAFSRLSPEQFVATLCQRIDFRFILAGFNFRFGHRRAGDIQTLKELAARYGFQVVALEACRNGSKPVSSSRIRQLVSRGDLIGAARLLNRPYFLEGSVASGAKLGKNLKSPTANIEPENELLPQFGVYATWSRLDGRWLRSITNIGTAPTMNRDKVVVETNLFGFEGTIYGKHLVVCFSEWLRPEKRFDSVEALRRQIQSDIQQRHALGDTFAPGLQYFLGSVRGTLWPLPVTLSSPPAASEPGWGLDSQNNSCLSRAPR